MTQIAAALEREWPLPNAELTADVSPLKQQLIGATGSTLWIIFGAATFVLLIACVNVTNLGLVRLSARSREVAVRVAHGARRGHILRQFSTESLVLVGGSVIGGLLLARGAVRVLVRLGPQNLPRLDEIRVDPLAIAVGLGLALAIALLLGIAPGWLASGVDLSVALRSGGGRATDDTRQRRLRAVFGVSEIALAVVLLVAAGLLLASYRRLTSVPPGFNVDHVVTMSFNLRGAAYREPTAQAAFNDRLLERVRALPGVTSAAVVDGPPLSDGGVTWTYAVEAAPPVAPGHEPRALYHVTCPSPLWRRWRTS